MNSIKEKKSKDSKELFLIIPLIYLTGNRRNRRSVWSFHKLRFHRYKSKREFVRTLYLVIWNIFFLVGKNDNKLTKVSKEFSL
jgi:hypothetical protein